MGKIEPEEDTDGAKPVIIRCNDTAWEFNKEFPAALQDGPISKAEFERVVQACNAALPDGCCFECGMCFMTCIMCQCCGDCCDCYDPVQEAFAARFERVKVALKKQNES